MVRMVYVYLFLILLSACGGGGGGGDNTTGTPTNNSPPNAPTDVTATGGQKSVEVSWTGSAGATQYNVYWSDAPNVMPQNGIKATTTVRQLTIQGLTNGTTYYAVVTAENSRGESTASAQTQAQAVATSPDPVTGVAAFAGDGEATVEWDLQPDADYYSVEWSSNSSGGGRQEVETSPYVINGLTNGTTYTISIRGENEAGSSSIFSFKVGATPLANVPGWTSQIRINKLARVGGYNVVLKDAAINDSGVAAVAWTNALGRTNGAVASDLAVNYTTDGVWGEPLVLSDQSPVSAAVEIAPNDDIYVAYDKAASEIWIKRFRNGTWSEATRLDADNPRLNRAGVQMAIDDQGDLYVAWVETIGSPGAYSEDTQEVWARRFEAGTETWGPATRIGESIRRVDGWSFSAETSGLGSAIVTWLQDTLAYDENQMNGGPKRRVVYASHFDGISWQTGSVVGSNDLGDLDTTAFIALDVNSAGSGVISWILERDQDPRVDYRNHLEAARYDARLGQWSAPEMILDSPAWHFLMDASIADNDEITVAWNAAGIDSSTYNPVTASWGPAELLPIDWLTNSNRFVIERDRTNKMALAWTHRNSDTTGVFVRWLDSGSDTWSNADQIGGLYGHEFVLKISGNGHAIVATHASVEMYDESKATVYANIFSP